MIRIRGPGLVCALALLIAGAGCSSRSAAPPPKNQSPMTPAALRSKEIPVAFSSRTFHTAQSEGSKDEISEIDNTFTLGADGSYFMTHQFRDLEERNFEKVYSSDLLSYTARPALPEKEGAFSKGVPTTGLEANERDFLETGGFISYAGHLVRALAESRAPSLKVSGRHEMYFDNYTGDIVPVQGDPRNPADGEHTRVVADGDTGVTLLEEQETWSDDGGHWTFQTWTTTFTLNQGTFDFIKRYDELWNRPFEAKYPQPGENKYKRDVIEWGFSKVSLEKAPPLVPYVPVHLGKSFGEYVLVSVEHSKVSYLSPWAKDVLVFVYLKPNSYERLTVTNRGHPKNVNRGDPFPLVDEYVSHKLTKPVGILNRPIVAAIDEPVHQWGIVGETMVSLQGWAHLKDIYDAAGALKAYP